MPLAGVLVERRRWCWSMVSGRLEALTRATSGPAGVAQRARIVLLAADGTPNEQIAELVGVSRPTVDMWRNRYSEQRMAGLVDEDRVGPERRIDPRRIVETTLTPPPKSLGVTHWSSRLLAAGLGSVMSRSPRRGRTTG